jgi:hypothetical protein
MGRPRNATKTGAWTARRAVAPALLCLVAAGTVGCLNPLFFTDVEVPVNHAPILTGLVPEPSVRRREINVAANCVPLDTFRAARLDDADFDVLTVRWTLFLDREGSVGGARERIVEEELVPLDPPVDGIVYDLRPFVLDRTKVLAALGSAELAAQTGPGVEGQLLELRISDGGFKTGTDEPPDGAALLYHSWAIKLTDVAGECS